MQSRRGPMVPFPDFHRRMERIISEYMPPIPEGLLGARNTARAEWKTESRAMPAVNQWMDGIGGKGVSSGFT